MSRLVTRNRHSKKGGGKDMGRIKGLVVVLMLLAVTAFLGVSQARAATRQPGLYGVCGTTDKAFATSTDNFYYKVAYEAYDPVQIGASTVVAPISVVLSHDLTTNDTLNLQLKDAEFNPDQGVYYALVGVDDNTTQLNYEDLKDNLTGITFLHINTPTNSVHIVAITSSTVSSPTATLAFKVDNATGAHAEQALYLVQVSQPVANVDNYTVQDIGSGVHVLSGLDASCTNTPEVLISFSSPYETVSGKVFAKIMPMCGPYEVGKDLLRLNAELNTDKEFKEFLRGTAVVNALEINTHGTGCGISTCEYCNSGCSASTTSTENTCETAWISGNPAVCENLTATISFDLISLSSENAITSVTYNGTPCVANQDKTAWACTGTEVNLNTGAPLDIKINGDDSLLPTTWTIKNLSMTLNNDVGFKNTVCYAKYEGNAGAWYGGLEALVPFVKYDPNLGYQTFIKFFNRNDKPAKVFAVAFNSGNGGDMLVATTLVGTIQPNDNLTLTGEELAEKLGISPERIAYGVPIKFMIMAPSAQGCNGLSATLSGVIDNASANGTTTVTGALSGNACPINPYDPYIEGIVVSTTPQGQRSIPLEFKYFKNGSYVQ